jgi:hypothetical protein
MLNILKNGELRGTLFPLCPPHPRGSERPQKMSTGENQKKIWKCRAWDFNAKPSYLNKGYLRPAGFACYDDVTG